MLQGNCGNCIFWESEDGNIGKCPRATGTTKESGCGSAMPRQVAQKIGEAIAKDKAFIEEVKKHFGKEEPDGLQGKRQRKQKGREEDQK